VYITHHRTVHLPVISLPASQRYPKYRTATLLLVLENKGVVAVGVIVSKTVQLYIVNISVAFQQFQCALVLKFQDGKEE
jgi:hypothetical protein